MVIQINTVSRASVIIPFEEQTVLIIDPY